MNIFTGYYSAYLLKEGRRIENSCGWSSTVVRAAKDIYSKEAWPIMPRTACRVQICDGFTRLFLGYGFEMALNISILFIPAHFMNLSTLVFSKFPEHQITSTNYISI